MRGWRLLLAGLHLDVGNSVLVRVLDQVPFLVILLHSLLDDTGVDVVDGNSLRGRRTPQLEVGCREGGQQAGEALGSRGIDRRRRLRFLRQRGAEEP